MSVQGAKKSSQGMAEVSVLLFIESILISTTFTVSAVQYRVVKNGLCLVNRIPIQDWDWVETGGYCQEHQQNPLAMLNKKI